MNCRVWLLLLAWPLFAQDFDFDRIRSEEEFRTGVTAFHNGLFNRAIIAFERSLNYKPEQSLTRLWLGWALFQSGFENSAVREWENVLRQNPQNSALQAWLESVRFRRGVMPLVLGRDRMLPLSVIEGKGPTGALRFQGPAGLRPLRNGGFLAAVFASQDILQVNLNGEIIRRFPGSVEGFLGPMDIESFGGLHYVSEFRADRIAVVNDFGIRQAVIGQRGRGPGQLLGPQYLAIDARGGLYVSEWGNRRVSKFQLGPNPEFLFHIGQGDLRRPSGLTLVGSSRDRLLVADRESSRLVLYDLSGNRQQEWTDPRFREAEGLWTDPSGTVWVAAGRRVLLFQPSTGRVDPLDPGWEQGARLNFAIVDQNGHIVVSDVLDNAFRLYAPGSSLYAALAVRVLRVNTRQYPRIFVEVVVEDRFGRPVVGLERKNFYLKESDITIQEFDMDTVGWDQRRLSVSVVLDRMPWMFQAHHPREAAEFLRSLVQVLRGDGGVWLHEAVENPIQPQTPWTSPAEAAALALNTLRQTDRGRLDQSLRLAAGSLLGGVGKRAVLFLTTGSIRLDSFNRYDLVELAQFYQNNLVAFHVVRVGRGPISDELRYLAEKTGGSLVDAAGLNLETFLEDLRGRAVGNYVLSYHTITPPENGLRYIPVSVEVNVFRKSGRNELGFFAPLNQRVFN